MPPKRATEAEKQQKRDEILEAATYLISRGGYDNFTVRKLAKELGMSATNIYNYFLNREEILLNVVDRGFRSLTTSKYAAYEQGDSVMDGIRQALWAVYNFSIQQFHLYDILFIQRLLPMDMEFSDERLKRKNEEMLEAYYDSYGFWEDVISQLYPDMNSDDIRVIVVEIGTMIHGALRYYHNLARNSKFGNASRVVNAAISHILNSLEDPDCWGLQ